MPSIVRSSSRPRKAARERTARERRGWKREVSWSQPTARLWDRLGTRPAALRKELLTPDTRKRSARWAPCSITLASASRRIATAGAFHSDEPSGGVANENTYTMHDPFLALHHERRMPARLRIEFLHQDSPTANPPLPTLSQRLKNSFPFFGDDWIRTGGIGEFTGGGIDGLRAIAKAGWRAEDHALNLAVVTN